MIYFKFWVVLVPKRLSFCRRTGSRDIFNDFKTLIKYKLYGVSIKLVKVGCRIENWWQKVNVFKTYLKPLRNVREIPYWKFSVGLINLEIPIVVHLKKHTPYTKSDINRERQGVEFPDDSKSRAQAHIWGGEAYFLSWYSSTLRYSCSGPVPQLPRGSYLAPAVPRYCQYFFHILLNWRLSIFENTNSCYIMNSCYSPPDTLLNISSDLRSVRKPFVWVKYNFHYLC